MGMIGNNVGGAVQNALTPNAVYAHALTSAFATFTTSQKLLDYYIRQVSGDGTVQLKMMLYTTSNNSAIGSTPVAGTEQVITTSNVDWEKFHKDVRADNIIIPPGTYLVALWSDGFKPTSNTDFIYNSDVQHDGVTEFPSPLAPNATSLSKLFEMYILTEDAVAVTDPFIQSVGDDTGLANSDTNVAITGGNFRASGNAIRISLVDDPADESAVDQGILTNESTSSVTIPTVILPAGAEEAGLVYVFLLNVNIGFSSAYIATVNVTDGVTKLTVAFNQGDPDYTVGAIKVYTLTADFADGVQVERAIAGDINNTELATGVSSSSNLPTKQVVYSCVFPSGSLSDGAGDTFKVIYDDTIGKIVSIADNSPLASGEYTGVVCQA